MKLSTFLFVVSLAAPAVWAQGLEYVKAHYTKSEFQIPVRDGQKLFTSVYTPKDTEKQYPIMLMRTPYSVGPYGVDNYKTNLGPSEIFSKDGYIFVYQDVRGRWMSEGEYANMRPHNPVKRGPSDIDESTDTWDTIDWLVKRIPNNNGRVGMWGISYPGFYVAAGMIDAHPALKAASPQAPIADWFIGDDFHHNGALYLPHAFGFFSRFGHPRPEPIEEAPPRAAATKNPNSYDFFMRLGPLSNVDEKVFKGDVAFWNELMRHPNYDEFWQARNLRPHLKNIHPAVMTVGGRFDAEDLFGALNTYASVEKQSPSTYNILVMGPWYHGGWAGSDGAALGNVQFGSKTAVFYRENIEFPFFRYYLKLEGDLDLPEAYVFETGTNQWRRYDAWPPKEAQPKSLFFRAHGKLSFDRPEEETAFDEYVSDPARPVPYIGETSFNMTREHMVEDQRFAATRPDVLVYETEPLTEDVTVAGPISPHLFVSTTGTDSDWAVKLIDVYPDNYPNPDPNPAHVQMGGYQQLLRGELMRGRFRHSYSKPEASVPGKMEKIDYVMPGVNHAFRRGHRVMIQVQSSWFPLADRNPQKFVDIYQAKADDFQKATERVYRSRTAPSAVEVDVIQ
ncbi:MAG: X-Pro dipeptidyl-peptidase [Acidobacteria bacterium]|nr:MAG: X-Pro dipeptidyl-peptidase [Acidobacteriota bacterium]